MADPLPGLAFDRFPEGTADTAAAPCAVITLQQLPVGTVQRKAARSLRTQTADFVEFIRFLIGPAGPERQVIQLLADRLQRGGPEVFRIFQSGTLPAEFLRNFKSLFLQLLQFGIEHSQRRFPSGNQHVSLLLCLRISMKCDII